MVGPKKLRATASAGGRQRGRTSGVRQSTRAPENFTHRCDTLKARDATTSENCSGVRALARLPFAPAARAFGRAKCRGHRTCSSVPRWVPACRRVRITPNQLETRSPIARRPIVGTSGIGARTLQVVTASAQLAGFDLRCCRRQVVEHETVLACQQSELSRARPRTKYAAPRSSPATSSVHRPYGRHCRCRRRVVKPPRICARKSIRSRAERMPSGQRARAPSPARLAHARSV